MSESKKQNWDWLVSILQSHKDPSSYQGQTKFISYTGNNSTLRTGIWRILLSNAFKACQVLTGATMKNQSGFRVKRNITTLYLFLYLLSISIEPQQVDDSLQGGFLHLTTRINK